MKGARRRIEIELIVTELFVDHPTHYPLAVTEPAAQPIANTLALAS